MENKKIYMVLLALYPLVVHFLVRILFSNSNLTIPEYLFINISLTINGTILLILLLLNKL